MKSREEYRASIYAKRDALLIKRKKRITQAITLSCTAILLTASAAALPSFFKKPTSEIKPVEYTTTAFEAYGSIITQPNTDYDNLNENIETVKDLAEAVAERAETVTEAVPKGTTERVTKVVRYPVSKQHSNYPFIEEESIGAVDEAVDEAVNESSMDDSIRPEFQNEMYFEAERSAEEIAEAAFGYLSDEQKAECINADSPEIINVTSSSEKRYIVSFKTNGKTIYHVQLGYPDLELIEIDTSTEKEAVSEPSTHKPGYKGGTQ